MSMPAEIHRVMLSFLLVVMLGGFGNAAGTENFASKCGETFDIGDSGGRMDSQVGYYYDNDVDCTVTLTTSFSRKILLTFNSFDIQIKGDTSACKSSDYLEVFDDVAKFSSLAVICGEGVVVDPITSTVYTITLQFKTNNNVTDTGFYFTYTSYSDSSVMACKEGEFECTNGRCIDDALTSDFYDNCGDSSESGDLSDIYNTAMGLLQWGIGVLIAIIVGIIVAVVLCCVCVGCLCYHCCCKKRQQTQYTGVTQTGPPAYNQQPPMAMQPAKI